VFINEGEYKIMKRYKFKLQTAARASNIYPDAFIKVNPNLKDRKNPKKFLFIAHRFS
jgi:hypothetical protein